MAVYTLQLCELSGEPVANYLYDWNNEEQFYTVDRAIYHAKKESREIGPNLCVKIDGPAGTKYFRSGRAYQP